MDQEKAPRFAWIKSHFKLWWIAVPIIIVFSLFQLTSDLGEQGLLDSPFLRTNIYPLARTVNGLMTNIKFKIRGEESHKQKIVILAIDEDSLSAIGRWPWHRDDLATTLYYALKMGAKLIALDVVFAEKEERVPEALLQELEKANLSDALRSHLKDLDTDQKLEDLLRAFQDRIVLGFPLTGLCWPRYDGNTPGVCPVDAVEATQEIESAHLDKLALPETIPLPLSQIKKTPMNYIINPLPNLKRFNDAAKYAGIFFASPDPDGFIRRYSLLSVHQSKVYPSLALAMARLIKGKEIHIEYTQDARIQRIGFGQDSTDLIPSTPLGYLDLNFRAGHSSPKSDELNFTTLSVVDLFRAASADEEPDPAQKAEKLKIKERVQDVLKDSYAFLGATALGIFDMRAFPLESNAPGVEGHAVALDNMLSGDALRSASSIQLGWLPLALLWVLGLTFAIIFSEMDAIANIGLFVGFIILSAVVDIQFLFKNHINFPTAFLLIEVSTIFVVIVAIRFILEERKKKFIRQAFSHYLAPQVVEFVLKDPSKLTIGGERRELSVLFTDIRGFTTLSETMEPKELSNFLNEYLTAMTDIIFEFGGTLDKYIGDAVMAFWGAPIFREDHAFQAAQAAIKMQKKMLQLQGGFKQKYGANLSMGVGLNSGVVSVGNMGSSKIFDYTVIGDQVNLASRLEGLNRIYGTGVLCAEQTLLAMPESMRSQLDYRRLDSVKVKGKTQAIELIELCLHPVDAAAQDFFEKGRAEFKKRAFDLAIDLFQKSSARYFEVHQEQDGVCEYFIERCKKYQKTPPSDTWDGSNELTEK